VTHVIRNGVILAAMAVGAAQSGIAVPGGVAEAQAQSSRTPAPRAAQPAPPACDAVATRWRSGPGAGADALAMVEFYKSMPRACVAERAEALLRTGQAARRNGLLLEAAADGSPVVRWANAGPLPVQSAPIIPSAPRPAQATRPAPAPTASVVAAAPALPALPPAPVASAAKPGLALTDADLLGGPTARDYENAPSALARLRREVTVSVTGVLQADGGFIWTVARETPGESGLSGFALRLAERYRGRTVRADGVSLVGGQVTRVFRFKPR
jgi:hypothetical protein